MNKVALVALVFVGSLCGCRPSPFLADPPVLEQTTSSSWTRPARAVNATQVTAGNAHQLSEALWDEMDREARQEPVATASGPCKN